MKIEVGFGNTVQTAELPDENLQQVLLPNQVSYERMGAEEVAYALKHPIGSPALCEIVKPGEKIVIITSDITRPMPTYTVMPVLLDELYAAGVSREDITLVFALGSHRKHTEEEKEHLAGERAYKEIRCIDGDPEDVVHLGQTSSGTPVDIVRTVVEADRRILLGNIEYHYFAGYSGGAKAIMPGVSTWNAIQANHSMMIREGAHAGNIATNPIRKDIEEAAAIVGADFILNVVLDEHKKIIKAVAGDITEAHREGCRFLDALYQVKIEKRADIVVVSQGGAPKDLNLYQTQKALDNAKHAVKDGGVVILVGSCREGLGNPVFESWMREAETPDALVERIHREFRLGGHKAAAIAMVRQKADIFMVSEMDPELVKDIFMTPFTSMQEALDEAFRLKGGQASVIVMPYGGSTLPVEKS
ncbi:MAG: nickel-dependent lactate racemase [Blautia sp.]|nr:nickel-dependent lactate racemase [Blautia sp.]